MLQFADEHREEGKALQEELTAFQGELSRAIEEVWARSPPEFESKDVATTSVPQNAMGVGEGVKSQDPLDKIAKPQIVEPTWRVTLWDKK
jgi:elongator complex protein 1